MATITWDRDSVRKQFIQYFESKAHTFVPSSAVVPHEDPTLLFTNAGMNQFKPIFLGTVDPTSPLAKLKRACNSQKCIRAGGKHNDLEDVGRDVYHHTFFEMLGNWSFGDYFKEEAISWAWDLLVNVYKVNPDRLYATYFGGLPEKGLAPDDEARQIWLRYLPSSRVLPFGMKENFWEMGDTGPCGPCTEIHYDRIGGRDAASLVNADDPDVLEIWNNVFIQFNREDNGELRTLPAKHVDTGMGFERLTSVLQGKRSNYDTDVFGPLFDAIQQVTKAPPYSARVGKDDTDNRDTAYRVVADHIRTLTFSLTDGAVPSNDGRGYVLRRILRRAVRYGKQVLGAPVGFFCQLSKVVVENFKSAFPELAAPGVAERVYRLIEEEELMFSKTLENGLNKFNQFVKDLKVGDTISGVDAAQLYDTFGFPLDLTQLMARERGLAVDVEGYDRRMKELKEISSRGTAAASGEIKLDLGAEQTDNLSKKLKIAATDDALKYDWTTEGKGPEHKAQIKAIYVGENKFVDTLSEGKSRVGLVLDRTNFYAESGGQIYDEGTITTADGVFQVVDVQKYGGFILHIGSLVKGSIKVDQQVTLKVDFARRALVAKNHTTTHLLNFALRQVLGKDADQKGSLVDPQKARFDFAASKAMTLDQLIQAEKIVQDIVASKAVVYREVLPLDLAKRISGLRAVFGEAYPDPVRVVSVGTPIADMKKNPEDPSWERGSVEFCGGTHLDNSGEAELFVIISEEGIAKGVRRIVSFTHQRARQVVNEGEALLREVRAAMSLTGAELSVALKKYSAQVNGLVTSVGLKDTLNKEVKKLSDKELQQKKDALQASIDAALKQVPSLASEAKDAKFLIVNLDVDGQAKALQSAASELSKLLPQVALLLVSEEKSTSKVNGLAVVPASATSRLDAAKWLNAVLEKCKGKAGGKPERAQGAAPSSEGLAAGLEDARQMAKAL